MLNTVGSYVHIKSFTACRRGICQLMSSTGPSLIRFTSSPDTTGTTASTTSGNMTLNMRWGFRVPRKSTFPAGLESIEMLQWPIRWWFTNFNKHRKTPSFGGKIQFDIHDFWMFLGGSTITNEIRCEESILISEVLKGSDRFGTLYLQSLNIESLSSIFPLYCN